MWNVNSAINSTVCRNGLWPSQELRRKSFEALLRRLDHGPDSEGSTPRYGSHCEEVPVSAALTTGGLDPAPDTGGLLLFYIFKCLFLYRFILRNT